MASLDEFEKETASIKHYKSSKPSIATDIMLILITGMFSIPAYAKTSAELIENGNQLLAMKD